MQQWNCFPADLDGTLPRAGSFQLAVTAVPVSGSFCSEGGFQPLNRRVGWGVLVLTRFKETAEELLWLRSAGDGDVAGINTALAESDTDILSGRLHTSDEIRRSLAL